MTRNSPISHRNVRRLGAALLVTASGLALASAPATAQEVVFSDNGIASITPGTPVVQTSGLTQVRMPNGAMLSFNGAAQYTIHADGSVTLTSGSVTVAGSDSGEIAINMPDGAIAHVNGATTAGVFTVTPDGESSGQTLTGMVHVTRFTARRDFDAGEAWTSNGRRGLRQVVSNGPQATPPTQMASNESPAEPEVLPLDTGGPVAAAANGLPVSLGDALAAAGASSDIVGAARRVELAAGNPDIDTFPSGDLALLVAAASRLEGLNGGTPFPQAQADIIVTYLGFLADGGSGAQFLTAYAGFLNQYLALVRSGALPSGFDAASIADINAFLAFQARNGALPQLAAQDRVLAEAYLAFLAGGGNVDLFTAQFTDLIESYFAFVRAGGDPADFTGGSAALVDQYIAFLNDSGLLVQLSAQNQALLAAYLANGGIGFAADYRAALDAYYAFLEQGGLPSGYTAVDQATLQAYIAALQSAGLLGLLGDNAQFYADYLAYLQAGGNPDTFVGLPVSNLPAFADALNAYGAFLAAGGLPSDFTATDLDLLATYIEALRNAGQLQALLGNNAGLLDAYFAYLATGANANLFSGLPIYADYVGALQAYFAFLDAGGLPADYTVLTPQQVQDYLAALAAAGGLNLQLGNLASFYTQYFAFIQGGGNPVNFSGLPIYADYVAALNAYFAFLDAGGLPADYTALTPQQVQDYLTALAAAGGLNLQLGNLAAFYTQYFAFISAGGDPVNFAGLPVYADYVAALNAYFAFLAGGGLPDDYTALTPAQISAYLAALVAAGGLDLQIGGDAAAFFASYLAFIQGGGDPQQFAGLPIYVDYLAAIEAYYAFLLNGGVPSGYTALTQAQIQAYLAALSAAGLLTGTYTGDELDFYIAYLAYLAGGGVPDSFGGLPGNTYVPPVQLAYAGGFNSANPRMRIFSGGTNGNGGNSSASLSGVASSYTIDAQGRLTAIQRQQGESFTINSASVVEVSGNETFLIGRWTDGTFAYDGPIDIAFTASANNGLNYLLVAPVAGNFTMPASGTVLYDVAGATAPFYRSGSNPVGTYDAQLGIGFGSQLTFGIEGTLTMPRRGATDHVWTFSTPGGVQDPSGYVTAFTPALDAHQFNFDVEAQVNQDICVNFGGCFISHSIYFGGSDTDTVGASYYTYGSDDDEIIVGNAIFAKSGEIPDATGTTVTNQVLAFANPFVGNDVNTGVTVDYSANSAIVQYTNAANDRTALGTASVIENGTSGSLTWTRWADGKPSGVYFGTTNFDAVGSAGGYHMIAGAPVTNMPASGTVLYDLVGFTTPTRHDEDQSGGSVSGQAAVLFGAAPKLGLDMDVTSGTDQLNLATAGGVTDVSQSGVTIDANGLFRTGAFNNPVTTTQVAGTYCNNGCNGFITGFLAGDGAVDLGLSYTIRQEGAPFNFIDGTAAFARSANQPTPTPTAFTGTRTGVTDYLGRTGNGLGNSFFGTADLVDGKLRRLTLNSTSFFDIGTASVAESGDFGDIAWARWTNGQVSERSGAFSVPTQLGVNGGWHVMSGLRATNLPTSGLLSYQLLETTAVTELNGPSTGTLTGNLGVLFGPLSKVGFDFQIAYRGRTWAVTTPGGAADPTGGIALVSNASELSFDASFTSTAGNVTATGGACVSFCEVQVEGALFGSGAAYAGVGVGVEDTGSADGTIKASALAIFGNGNLTATPTPTPTPGPVISNPTSNFTGTRDNIAYFTFLNGSLASGFGGSATLANGALTDFSSILGTVSSNDTTIVDAGDVGDLAWARWTNGTVQNHGILGNIDSGVGPSGGYHVMAGTTTVTLPASGTIAYEQIGGTAATDNAGSAPGTLTGDLAIAFGSTSRVGYDLTMDVGGRSWTVGTTGGAADPASSQINLVVSSGIWGFGGTYTSTSNTVTAGGGACAATCIVTVSGRMFGANAAYAGVAMNVTDTSVQNGTIGASGIAIFGQEAAATVHAPASAELTATAATWARWDATGSTGTNPATPGGTGTGAPGLTPSGDGFSVNGVTYSAAQMQMLENYLQRGLN